MKALFDLHQHIDFLQQCEQIEILNLSLPGEEVFELPKLRVLVIKKAVGIKVSLVLRSPSLQILLFDCEVNKVTCDYPTELKHIECYEWPTEFKSNYDLTGLHTPNQKVAFLLA